MLMVPSSPMLVAAFLPMVMMFMIAFLAMVMVVMFMVAFLAMVMVMMMMLVIALLARAVMMIVIASGMFVAADAGVLVDKDEVEDAQRKQAKPGDDDPRVKLRFQIEIHLVGKKEKQKNHSP